MFFMQGDSFPFCFTVFLQGSLESLFTQNILHEILVWRRCAALSAGMLTFV